MKILKFEEFVNEGLYSIMNYVPSDKVESLKKIGSYLALGTIMFNSILAIFKASGIDVNIIHWQIYLTLLLFLESPIIIFESKSLIKKYIYNIFRSKSLIGKTNKKIEEIEKDIEKYPELKDRLVNVKVRLRPALENNKSTESKEIISDCIHEIYEISKILRRRKKYGALYKKSEEEIEKEENIKGVDPYGEELW